MNNSTPTTPAASEATSTGVAAPLEREEAERELMAARAELASLGSMASPSRLERALERLAAARHLLALAA